MCMSVCVSVEVKGQTIGVGSFPLLCESYNPGQIVKLGGKISTLPIYCFSSEINNMCQM